METQPVKPEEMSNQIALPELQKLVDETRKNDEKYPPLEIITHADDKNPEVINNLESLGNMPSAISMFIKDIKLPKIQPECLIKIRNDWVSVSLFDIDPEQANRMVLMAAKDMINQINCRHKERGHDTI